MLRGKRAALEPVRHRGGVRASAVRLRRRPGVSHRRGGRAGRQLGRGGRVLTGSSTYRLAVQDAPDRPEYRIALERAMLAAARAHLAAARQLEAAGDLSGALIEYRQSYALEPSNGEAGVQIANLLHIGG